jgi:hypothetical protein
MDAPAPRAPGGPVVEVAKEVAKPRTRHATVEGSTVHEKRICQSGMCRRARNPRRGSIAGRVARRSSDRRIRIDGGRSLCRRVPLARFGYLLRGLHHRPSRRAKRRSVHGLRPSRRSPRHERHPSRGPCPLDVAGRPAPREGRRALSRLQGLVPVSSPCCHRIPEGTRPSMPSWASPLQSLLPIRPGDRL